MWDLVKEALTEGVRRGLPALGAVTGAFYGTKKGSRKIQYTGAALGWLVGWAAQKAILWAVTRSTQTTGLRLPVATGPHMRYNNRTAG